MNLCIVGIDLFAYSFNPNLGKTGDWTSITAGMMIFLEESHTLPSRWCRQWHPLCRKALNCFGTSWFPQIMDMRRPWFLEFLEAGKKSVYSKLRWIRKSLSPFFNGAITWDESPMPGGSVGLRRENGSISSAQCDPLLNHLVCTWDETRRLNEVKFDERRCAATNVQSCGLDLLVLFRIYVYSVCMYIFNDIYI